MQYIKNDAIACSLIQYLVLYSKYVCLNFFPNSNLCQKQSNSEVIWIMY